MSQTMLLDLMIAVGTILLLLGFVIYQVRKDSWVTHHGRRVVATITSIRHEMGETQQGWTRDNYYVTAQWTSPQTGKTYTFWTWICGDAPTIKRETWCQC